MKGKLLNKNALLRIIIVYLIINAVYFLFALFVSHFSSLDIDKNFSGFLQIHKQNDYFWYELIAEQGYPEISDPIEFGYNYNHGEDYKLSEWAFFPFYPVLMLTVSDIFNIPTDLSAFFISMIFAISGFYVFYLLALHWLNDSRKALFATIVFIVFPFHYHYSMFYTESIFFTFLGLSFLMIMHNKPFWLSLFLIPLVLLRPNGIVMLLPLFLFYLEESKIFHKGNLNIQNIKVANFVFLIPFLIATISFGIYCLYQYEKTGYFFAFSMAQVGWDKQAMFPLFAFFRDAEWSNLVSSFYSITAIMSCYFVWRRFSLSINVMVWITILLPLSAGSVVSMTRYISILFPFFILLGEYIYNYRYKVIVILVLFFSQLVFLKEWFFGGRISF